jgi:orotate phosphoribosyltransferase
VELLNPEVEGVGGMTLGADPVVGAVQAAAFAAGRPVHGFLIRKEPKGHGGGRQIEGLASLPKGSKVAVVEDTTTTGRSLLAAVEVARAHGLEVVQTITVVDREEGADAALRQQGLTLTALTTRSELLDSRVSP